MLTNHNRKVFISGPVSEPMKERGWLFVYNRFNQVADILKSTYPGVSVENPMELCSPQWSWIRCMMKCLKRLRKCSAVVMLNGWEGSRGSRKEYAMATRLGKKIMYENEIGELTWHADN